MELRLSNTIDLMNSENYKDRFIAEYRQTKIRYEKLKKFNNRIEACDVMLGSSDETLGAGAKTEAKDMAPKHDCPIEILKSQQAIMGQYLAVLEIRAEIEGIDID